MKKRSDQQATSLFEDLSVTESLTHRELIEVPTNDSLRAIFEDVKNNHACGACKPGMPVVFGEGAESADLMLVGEGPALMTFQPSGHFKGKPDCC